MRVAGLRQNLQQFVIGQKVKPKNKTITKELVRKLIIYVQPLRRTQTLARTIAQ